MLLAGAVSAVPMVLPPTEWPLERIASNLEQALREHPDDNQLHYLLGRALGLSFALERSSLWGGGGWTVDLAEQREHSASTSSVTPAESLAHLASGVLHLRKACELPDQGPGDKDAFLYGWWNSRKHLTFAWLLETGAHLADRVATIEVLGVTPQELAPEESAPLERSIDDLGSSDPAVAEAAENALASPTRLERALALLSVQTASPNARRQKAVAALLERYWIERAIAEYWVAYQENVELDLSVEGWEVERLVSLEALLGYERLILRRGARTPEESRRLVELAEKKKRLEAHPHRGDYISPILLSVHECKSLDELITPDLCVPFDIDGDGIEELWPWVAPDTGWLVWDPHHRGEITSGRQLFGSASAWLFFEDGYRVLDALDDDRDGELRGDELAGIAVWFDRDSDGVSDRGEVVPVEELGIAALATESTLTLGASPANLCGVEMQDGRVLPTYDWVLAPVADP
jgi:hypothetical protein